MEHWKTKYLLNEVNKIGSKKKLYEIAIVLPIMMNEENLLSRPTIQYPLKSVSGNQYYIDLYYPDLKLAIEIDENHHNYRTEKDNTRQKEIEHLENCEFLRIDVGSSNFNIVESIKEANQKIQELINYQKNEERFIEWEEIQTFTLDEVINGTKNTIIIKTVIKDGKEIIPTNEIGEEIKKNAEHVLFFSSSTEYHSELTSFSGTSIDSYVWDKNNKYFPSGSAENNYAFKNIYLKNWNKNRSYVYSSNLKNPRQRKTKKEK